MGTDFWEKWFPELGESPTFGGVGEYFEEYPGVPALHRILQTDIQERTSFGRDLLTHGVSDNLLKAPLQELASGIWAYSQFQDILELPIELDAPIERVLNRHYCYYESMVFLRELALSFVDGHFIAAIALCRPFLELSILHLYWKLRTEEKSRDVYYEWLAGTRPKPPFRNAVDYVVGAAVRAGVSPRERVEDLGRVLVSMFCALSSYNHTPSQDESFVTRGGSNT